jgi:hypothetical protein
VGFGKLVRLEIYIACQALKAMGVTFSGQVLRTVSENSLKAILHFYDHGKIVVRTRAWPSGKASAFQADIRGSESRRPLRE